MNELAVKIAIILFPGLIATIVSYKITVHFGKWGSFKFIIYSFVLGTFCYFFLQIANYIFDIVFYVLLDINKLLWSHLNIWKAISDNNVSINWIETFQAAVLSFPVAFIASFIVNHKIFNKLARKLRVSNKYGDENLFSYYLNAEEVDWVYIRDIENNLTYQGRIDSYSENDNIQEIVLYDVTIFSYNDSEELYSLPSIYLCKAVGKFIIETIPMELLEEDNEKEKTAD